MPPERVTMRLVDILPNDFPDEKSWARVLNKFPHRDPGLFDLDTIKDKDGFPGVKIVEGNKCGYCARNGNHTLARILQLHGDDVEVTFSKPNDSWFKTHEIRQDVDSRVGIIAEWGVKNFIDFLNCCLERKFYKSGPHETNLW